MQRPTASFTSPPSHRAWNLASCSLMLANVTHSETKRWTPGSAVIVRTVLANGRVGTVLPTRVVRDDDLVALYLAPGTPCKRRAGTRGGPRGRLLIEDYGTHEDWTWRENRRLILWRPNDMHAVSPFWRQADDTFLGWYVDILLPLRRTPMGFDTRDLVLDIVIAPDRTWHWKDEDELAWFQEQGLRTAQEVSAIWKEAERAVGLLEAGDPIFSETWVSWRPNPAWTIPSLPDEWSRVNL